MTQVAVSAMLLSLGRPIPLTEAKFSTMSFRDLENVEDCDRRILIRFAIQNNLCKKKLRCLLLGATLRKYRHAKHFTQRYLGELINIHQACVSQIELGSRMPSVSILERFVEALDVPMEILMRDVEFP